MSLGLLGSALVAIAIGVLALRVLWPARVVWRPYRWLALSLGVGTGLGLTTVLLFGWLVLIGVPGPGLIALEVALLAVLAIAAARRGRHQVPVGPPESADASDRAPGTRVIGVAFMVTLVCAAGAFTGLSAAAPHGGWDAWMNWNLRARLIFRAGPEWRDAFSPLLAWSHPDYPLLVQGSIVRAWIYQGGETLAGPVGVALLFTGATVALLTTGVAAFRGRGQAMLAGLVLLATPFFIFHGASQYGDVPVGFFFLATLVLLGLHERHKEHTDRFALLAGLTAGLAAWTKNEGLLFVAALAVAAVLTRRNRRELRTFALGLLPMLVVIALFKLVLAPSNDLMSAMGSGTLIGRATDPHRYALVARAFVEGIMGFGVNGLVSGVWLLVAYGLCVWRRSNAADAPWFRLAAGTLVVMLLGHAAVFVLTAPDVARLLNSSLERLLLQLWPAALLVYFLGVATPEEAAAELAEPRELRAPETEKQAAPQGGFGRIAGGVGGEPAMLRARMDDPHQQP
jgi:hypothetical protein